MAVGQPVWSAERLKSFTEEVGAMQASMQFLSEQLDVHKRIVAEQTKMMAGMEKRAADLEVLVRKKPPPDDEG